LLISNLRRVLGEWQHDLGSIARRTYRNFGRYLVEFLRIPIMTADDVRRIVCIKGREHIDRALAQGRGVILVTFHFGNWELAGVALASWGYRMNAVIQEHRNRWLNRLFIKSREDKGMKAFPLGVAVRNSLRALRNNELVAFVADRDIGGDGVDVDFFGQPTSMPAGPVAFSLKTGSPIIPGFMIRNDDNTHTIYMHEPIEMEITGDRESDIVLNLGKVVKTFEPYILKYPDRWFAFHPLRSRGTDLEGLRHNPSLKRREDYIRPSY
jgi:KDO2-lipid IV(A) lauroyltransferase